MQPQGDRSPGVWVSLSELARRRSIQRSSVKERVDRLEGQGLITTRRDGNRRLVELAAFDRAIGQAGDSIKELAAEAAHETRSQIPGALRDAQVERAQYEAQLKALDLAERQGALLPIKGAHGVEETARRVGIAVASAIDGLVKSAEEIASAVSREGVAGARRVLKRVATEVRARAAESIGKLVEEGEIEEVNGSIVTDLFNE